MRSANFARVDRGTFGTLSTRMLSISREINIPLELVNIKGGGSQMAGEIVKIVNFVGYLFLVFLSPLYSHIQNVINSSWFIQEIFIDNLLVLKSA